MEGLKNQSVHGKIANAGKNLKKSFERNIKDGFGEWVFTPQTITGTLTDFTIDLSFGAAGVAADYVINNVGIFDCDGDGKKDSAVDVSKKMVDSVLKDRFNW